ncbi:MAG: beta strand repeat-containing protein [Myxococcota bacterium]
MAIFSMGSPARALPFLLGAALCFTSCSSSSDDEPGPSDPTAGSVVQNLTVDPDGETITVDITGAIGTVTAGSLEASGGQNPVSVVRTGDSIAVEFDARVTPEHQVRLTGVEGISGAWRTVTTSDARAPRATVLSATQDTSDNELGGDTLRVAFFGGPRVVESEVMDIANWTVNVGGLDLDLAGSSATFDTATQVAELTLGSLANLHATFEVSVNIDSVAAVGVDASDVPGAATGDSDAPSFEGGTPVTQNIVEVSGGDVLGRVVDFDFNEPISPVFGAQPANFSVVDHPGAIGMTSITRVSVSQTDDSVVRVSFSRPVVPGLDQLLVDGVVDAHGNPFPAQTVPFTAGTTVANGFDSVTFVTEEGADNDYVEAVLTQAIDPDTAELPATWGLNVTGIGAVDLTTQEISYDLSTRTIRVDLDFDVLNSTTAELSSVGAVDIDGEDFTVTATPVAAAGDASAPTLEGIVQNREVDTDGQTIDVSFSEDLDVVEATNTANYTFDPVRTVNTATLVDGSTVRLQLSALAVPGDVTLAIAQAVSDPAGNDLGAPIGATAMTSTDEVAPGITVAAARAVEGPDNDTVTVLFNDVVIQAEVEDTHAWSFESPVGNAIDLSAATVNYDATVGTATLLLGGSDGAALLNTDDFQVTVSGFRDIAGNTAASATSIGAVIAESNRPAVESIFAVSGGSGNQIIIRFSEAMGGVDNLYDAGSNPTGVRYIYTQSGTSVESLPQTVTSLDDGLGAILTFGSAVDTISTLSVVGLTDLAGNLLFPVLGSTIAAEVVTAPAMIGAPTLTAVSGNDNDTIDVQFNVPMASWKLLEPSQYSLAVAGGGAVDLSDADFSFDGNDTVTIKLDASTTPELGAAQTFDVQLNVDPNDPLRSVQGVVIAGVDTQGGAAVTGDVTTGPQAAGSRALLHPVDPNGLIVVFDETVDMSVAQTAGSYEYNSTVADAVTEYTDRAVYVEFSVPVAVAGTLEIQASAAVDSAGNQAVGLMTLAVQDDTAAPTIQTMTAVSAEGLGGDVIVLAFDEELDASTAGNRLLYTVTSGGEDLRIGAAIYSSNDLTVTLIPDDLPDGGTIVVEVDGVTDLIGNAPVAPLTDSAVASGDSVAPSIVSMVVNSGFDSGRTTVDVLFSEPVVSELPSATYNWSSSGIGTIQSVDVISGDYYRITLSNPVQPTDMLTLIAGLLDYAGNEAGELTFDPVD